MGNAPIFVAIGIFVGVALVGMIIFAAGAFNAARLADLAEKARQERADADRAVDYCGIVEVGPDFYDRPDIINEGRRS